MSPSLKFVLDQSILDSCGIEILIKFQVYFDSTEGPFLKSKIYKNTITSHVNSSESNDLNKYNSDNAIVNSNIHRINVYTECSPNELVTL